MVSSCIICRKEPIPSSNNPRSFHLFPSNSELNAKWMQILGLTSLPKYARICSDHFDTDAYNNTYGVTMRKRLLPNAVPKFTSKCSKEINWTSNTYSNCDTKSCERHENTSELSNIVNRQNMESFDISTYCTVNPQCIDDSDEIMITNPSTNNDEIATNTNKIRDRSKRKKEFVDVHLMKKIRFKIGFQTNYFSRKDFNSVEAWERFIQYCIDRKRQLKACQKKNIRYREKINSQNTLIKILKNRLMKVSTKNVKVNCTSMNCTPQDQTVMSSDEIDISDAKEIMDFDENDVKEELNENMNTIWSLQKPKFTGTSKENFSYRNYTFPEHDYCKSDSNCCASENNEEIVKQVAAFIVFILSKKIKCQQCLIMLERNNIDNISVSRLPQLKNRGSSLCRFDDVNVICLNAEKVLCQNKDSSFSQNIMHKVVKETLQILPSSVFDDNKYSIEQDSLHDHRHQLILLILQKYLDARLCHKNSSLEETIQRIRMSNDKII